MGFNSIYQLPTDELHKSELLENWELTQKGELPKK